MKRVAFSDIIVILAVIFFGCGEENNLPIEENNKPIIQRVGAKPPAVGPGESSAITVDANDADGDELKYQYEARDGQIDGTGQTVTWTSPNAEGSYEIRVSVSDDKAPPVYAAVKVHVIDARPAESPKKYLYFVETLGYTNLIVDEGGEFAEHGGGPCFEFGDRLEILEEEADRYYVETYQGIKGYIPKRKVQTMDPKTYFTSTIEGENVIGFLRGSGGWPLNVLELKVGDGEADIPIHRVVKLRVGSNAIRVWLDEGGEFAADEIGGRFIYGPLPSIRSGNGIVLWLSSVVEPLLFDRADL